MSVVWIREKLKKYLREKQEDIKDTLLAGVKDINQYEYLRGQHTALVQVEIELRAATEK